MNDAVTGDSREKLLIWRYKQYAFSNLDLLLLMLWSWRVENKSELLLADAEFPTRPRTGDSDLDTSTQRPFPKQRASGVNLREVLLGCRLPSASEQHRRPSSTEGFPTDPSRRPSEPISTLAFSSLAFGSSSAPGTGTGAGEADASTPWLVSSYINIYGRVVPFLASIGPRPYQIIANLQHKFGWGAVDDGAGGETVTSSPVGNTSSLSRKLS